MNADLKPLGVEGLAQFQALQTDAVTAVAERFFATHGSAYERFGPRGRQACREDLTFHLEFLRPVLEFGLLQPMVDYLRWLSSVLTTRGIPVEHVAQSLEWLGDFFAGRMDTENGAAVTAALTAARMNLLRAAEAPALPQAYELWPEVAGFEAALLAGNQREAIGVMSGCFDDGHDLVDVERHVIQPALYDIGEKWQTNQVSVALEHMATAIAQAVMTVGLVRSLPPTPIHKRVLLACVEGNTHSVGLRMVADAFQLGGWDVQFLGASVPTQALIQQVAAWTPSLLGLSVSFAHQLQTVKAVVAQLEKRFGSGRPAVIIGGQAINKFGQLAGVLGADAFSPDARSAVAYANQLASA